MVKTPREALEETKRYWQDVPVRVFELATSLGLGPDFDHSLDHNISGLIRRFSPQEWRIVVNGDHARVRQRFTVAHEIGHFIFHRDLLQDGVSDTLAYRADDVVAPNPQIGRHQEWQANNFAANLLIPDYYLRAAQRLGFTDVADLARRFEVSETAMRIKLGLPIPETTPLLKFG